jgi:selenide,water dikinase
MDPAVLDQILEGLPTLPDKNLMLGFGNRDDAAVYRLPSGDLIVQTLDFFTPVVDDPYDFGAIAAANSLSDIYAMNGRPLFALNICCFPKEVPWQVWNDVMRGGAEKAVEAGINVIGGHTIDDSEPKYGMVVTGVVDEKNYWANEGARPGDALILTKPLGTGVLTTALKNETISPEDASVAIEYMKTLNSGAQQVLSEYEVHACTDVTGNGLLGHGAEMAKASKVKFVIESNSVPVFDGALALAAAGKLPGGSKANRIYLRNFIDTKLPEGAGELWLLYDAQTSGGLFCTLPEAQAEAAVRKLQIAGLTHSSIIGRVESGSGIEVL